MEILHSVIRTAIILVTEAALKAMRTVRHFADLHMISKNLVKEFQLKLLVGNACLLLLLSTTSLTGCSRYSKELVTRSANVGVPVEDYARIIQLTKRGDENDQFTDSEWNELYKLSQEKNSKTRLNAIYAIGGVSSKRTTQRAKIVEFLAPLIDDPDTEVSEAAQTFLEVYDAKK